MTTRSAKARTAGRLRRVAALHRQGGAVRLVVVESTSGRLEVVESRAIDSAAPGLLAQVIEASKAEIVLHVVSGAACVCRLVEVPDGRDEELIAALELLAEAELPESIPPNRRAAGVVEAPASEGNRSALIIGWMGRPDDMPVGEIPEQWTSEVVALATIAAQSQSAAILYADRELGSISMFASNRVRSGVRTLREQGDDQSDWSTTVRTSMDEMCRRVGHDPEAGLKAIDSGRALMLFVDEQSRGRFLDEIGRPEETDQWLQHYAIPVGAAIAYLRRSVASEPLFALQPTAVQSHRPLVVRTAMALARPGVAVVLIVLAAIVALLAPLGAAAVRHAVLASKVHAIESRSDLVDSQEELDRRIAMYEALERERWPMTKLIAEVGRALPVDSVVTAMNLDHGDQFTIRGEAKSFESVNEFASNLNGTGVFDAIEVKRIQADRESTSNLLEFDVSGRVVRPYVSAKGLDELDYERRTIVDRLYGPQTSSDLAVAESNGTDEADEETSSRSRRRARDLFNSTNAPAENVPPPPPDPLSDEAIAAMDRTAVMKEFGARKKASLQPGIDVETKQRLEDEVEKLRQRLVESRGGG